MGELSVTQVLDRFYPRLAYAIKNSALLPLWTPQNPHGVSTYAGPVQMNPDEVTAWTSIFKINGKEANSEDVAFTEEAIPSERFGKVRLRVTKYLGNGHFLANEPGLPKPWVYNGREHKLLPFNPHGLVWYIQPLAYFEPARKGRGIYRAGIEIKIFATDNEGRLAVSIPKPARPSVPAHLYNTILQGSYLAAYRPIVAGISFNTEFAKDEPGKEPVKNRLEIGLDTDTKLLLLAELHKPGEIDNIVVPDNPKVRLFFRQIASFIESSGRNGRTIDNFF